MSEISWEITSLSELGTFSRGKSKHRPRNDVKLFEGGKYPLVQTGDVKAANLYITKNDSYYNDFGLKQSKLWPAGTLCITIAANIAETAILSYPMCFPDSIVGFNANPEKSSELFVYYFFEYIKKEIQKSASGSIQDNINIDYLSKMRIKVPEKKYQDKIVELLSSIDKKILLNNQINQELEAMAKTLYDYWFVRFDFPDQNGKPYKSSEGKMVYNPELKREIPEGWGVESLVDNTLSTVIKPGIDEFTQKTYLATADVVNTSIKGGRLITYDNRETRANMQPSVNSVWFAKMKSSNKHLFLSHSMKELIDSTILSTGFMGLQCKEESFEYLASFISDPDFEIFKDKLSHGATQQAVNVNDLKSILVTIPDDYTLHEFHKKVKSIFLNIGRNTVEDKYLNSLRDWLLPMLMNGQVKVE